MAVQRLLARRQLFALAGIPACRADDLVARLDAVTPCADLAHDARAFMAGATLGKNALLL